VSLVSVIIPTYNRSSTLSSAINSVLVQSVEDYEIIVVDDASTDDTAACVYELQKRDNRIQYTCHAHNEGAQAARNTGIRLSRGKWIAFLDSDDQWLPPSLANRLEVARQCSTDVVHSDCYVTYKNGHTKQFGVPVLAGWVYRDLLARAGPMFQALLVAKKALERIGQLDEKIVAYQEWDTAIRLAKHYRFGFVQEPTFIYNCGGEDTISKNVLYDAIGYRQVVHKHAIPILLRAGPAALSGHYRGVAIRMKRAGYYKEARRYGSVSFVIWPFRLREFFRHIVPR